MEFVVKLGSANYNSKTIAFLKTQQNGNMPGRCVVGGCSNVQAEGIPMPIWPRNEKLARKWDRFVQIKRSDWKKGLPGVSYMWGTLCPG